MMVHEVGNSDIHIHSEEEHSALYAPKLFKLAGAAVLATTATAFMAHAFNTKSKYDEGHQRGTPVQKWSHFGMPAAIGLTLYIGASYLAFRAHHTKPDPNAHSASKALRAFAATGGVWR